MFMLATGMPVAFAFLLINIVGVFIFWGGCIGLLQLVESIISSVTTFVLLPIPLFILMGELMFRSGLAVKVLDALDKWMMRIPGRLGLLSVATGTLFSVMTGASQASVAMMGTLMVGEMEKRGYKKPMSLGPILGSGGLAIMIPPSAFGVFLAALADISVGKVLIGGIIPGLVMAFLYASYIIIRCNLQPSIAPVYDVAAAPLSAKLAATSKYILPLGFIVFLVIGLIVLGVATPTEAASTGALGSFILAAIHRKVNWRMIKDSIMHTTNLSVMIFMIITGSKAFSQIMVFSGASRGLTEFVIGLPLHPTVLVIVMLAVVILLGMFIPPAATIMIVLPIFLPVIRSLGFDAVWFGLMLLLVMEMSMTSPPFGLCLFVMKGVATPDTTMGDVFRAGLPFLGCDSIVLALMVAFPKIVTWLPEMVL
jgi:tripartite ATP-independent transporter DctM subunit